MSNENNLTFENNVFRYKSRIILGESRVPGITKFLLGKGIVKTEKTANTLLLFVTAISLMAAIYVFTVFVLDVQLFNRTLVQTPEQIQQREESRERFNKIREQRQNTLNKTQNPQ
jgi:hypothetical protein